MLHKNIYVGRTDFSNQIIFNPICDGSKVSQNACHVPIFHEGSMYWRRLIIYKIILMLQNNYGLFFNCIRVTDVIDIRAFANFYKRIVVKNVSLARSVGKQLPNASRRSGSSVIDFW